MADLIFKLFIKDFEDTGNPRVRFRYGVVSGFVGIFCNVVLFAAKLLIGFLSGSISIMADAFNNLSDAGSSVITLFGFKMAGKPADREHPFGHGRMEYIAGLIIAFLMVIVGVELGKSSVDKIISPAELSFDWVTILILVFSVSVKCWMAFFNKKAGEKINSETLMATAKDSINDVIATFAIIISVLIMLIFKINIDGYIGALVAVYIIFSGISAVKQTIDPLLGQQPDPDMVKEIVDCLMSYDEVVGVHDLIIHNYGPGRCIASVHAEVKASSDILKAHDTIDLAERSISEKLNILITVHMDPVETDNERVMALKEMVTEIARSIHEKITIHDFRIVEGDTHTNLIFDIVNPEDSGFTDGELKNMFEQKLKNISEKYFAVMTIDKDFTTR